MPAKSANFLSRRKQLVVLLTAPLIACTATPPIHRSVSGQAQKPQRLSLLPTEPIDRIALDQLSSSRTFSGGSGGLSRMALWDGRGSQSSDFTRLLIENGLAASQYLTDQVLAKTLARKVPLKRLVGQPKTELIVNGSRPDSIALLADATVDLELVEVAYAAASPSAFWPRIHATMMVTSTRDNARFTDQHYRVRLNAAPTDQRDITPQTLARFLSANELMANPRLVVKMLQHELEAMARLIALDLEALTLGQGTNWDRI